MKSTAITETSIDKLVFDDKNFNRGTQFGEHLMDKSIRELGLGRSILLDKNNRIIAGNKTTEKAGELGFDKVVVVETDGNTLVAVKRTDVDLDSQKGRELALADNATSKANLEWDSETLAECQEQFGIDTEGWGLDIDEIIEAEQGAGGVSSATAKLSGLEFVGMYYEPTEMPNIRLQDCYDLEKYTAKLKVIEDSGLSAEQKEVMRMFAYRFIKINFEAVANYYAFNATGEEKAVIERLRLVLVDGSIGGFIEDDLLRVRQDVMDTELDFSNADEKYNDYED